MSDPAKYSVWSVRTKEATAEGTTFDAQLLFHDAASGVPGTRPQDVETVRSERYYSHPVPFTRPLPDRPFTLVVRARGASALLVSVEQHDANGPTGSGSWCEGSCAVIVRTPDSTMSSSLPDEPE